MHRKLSDALLLIALLPPCAAQVQPRLAASLLWSEAFTVGTPHGGSGARTTGLATARWEAASGKGIKTFRVRPGAGSAWSPPLWMGGGDLAWALGGLPGGGNRMVGPEWVVEVLDVLERGDDLWLAWTGGVALSGDRGKTWRDVSAGLPARFVSALGWWRDTVWVGTEKGLARWDGRAGRFVPAGLAGIAVRNLLAAPEGLLVGTFRKGVYKVDSKGVASLGLAGCTAEGLAYHKGILYAATNRRGLVSRALAPGRIGTAEMGAWEPLKRWEVDAAAVVVVPPEAPATAPTLYVGTMGRGVWVSRDGGRGWSEFGLPGGHISSLTLYTPRVLPPAKADQIDPKDDPKTVVRKWNLARCRKNPRAINFYNMRWALEDEQLRPFALRRLRALLDKPKGDMFYQYPATGAWWHCRGLIPDALEARWRSTLLGYIGFRGDTENHLCMWHVALYLTAAAFPDAGPQEWHNGRTSSENLTFARAYLLRWLEGVFRQGMMEYDSPHYVACVLGPLFLLQDFAPEKRMRRVAEAAIHLLLADYAADNFKGIYAGGHSRNPRYTPYIMDWDPVFGMAWLYFGQRCPGDFKFSGYTGFAAMSGYACPEAIKNIANDRTARVSRFERKQVRTRWRYHGSDRNPPVFKRHYLTPWYTVGSTQGGILQPIQQHTWDASWRDKSGRARTLFTLHPYMNILEWVTFFPEDPIRMRAVAKATKGTYFKEDKWLGGSPHERIFQHQSTVIAYYRVPDGEYAEHLNAYLPAPPDQIKKAGDWLVVDSTPVYAALWCSGAYKLTPAPEDGARLRTYARPCAFVTEVSPAKEWPSFAAFCQALAKRTPACDHRQGTVAWRTLGGREMAYTWPDRRALDGEVTKPPADMLFLGPWIQCRRNSGVVRIGHGKHSLTLDWQALVK